MAAVATAPIDNDDNIDNTAITANIYYITVFVLGEYIVCILEYIVCCLPIPVMKDNNDTDDDNDEEEIEEMEEEL